MTAVVSMTTIRAPRVMAVLEVWTMRTPGPTHYEEDNKQLEAGSDDTDGTLSSKEAQELGKMTW